METEVAEVWGVGRKISKQLKAYNIENCYDLTFANEQHLMKQFSVVMARTIRELKGQSCIALDDPHIPSKRILASRSFATALSNIDSIKQALLFHLHRAHKRLMQQQQMCAVVHVSLYEKIAAAPYKKEHSQARGLEYATDDLLLIAKITLAQVDVLFKEKTRYVKVGLMLSALHPKNEHIDDLWQPLALIQQRDALMHAMSKMLQRFGADCIKIGYHSQSSDWEMRQQHRSPRYTTCRQEILSIDDSHMRRPWKND